ncbi:related to Guanine nucleotide-binding protein beta 5 [Sporisorium reilianum f. sp. reilianum]|uniref:Related to Guanine nucleotide-binding protein beta 5 n=1 Tax=Sporisorium reilianum f. sp. reilianum TaxID=72559 RepID=A0A2N8UH25_9BASI|nr:related to Guanine nucleotide-binding protein beta 5 [Sporisorium reilianum f. sp. reilianum]
MQSDDAEQLRTAEAAASDYPTPPELNIASWNALVKAGAVTTPHLLISISSPSQCSTAQSEEQPNHKQQLNDFYRRASWSPDGSRLLAVTESQQKHVYRYSRVEGSNRGKLERHSKLKSPSPLLDTVWYPLPAMEQPTEGAVASTSTTWCFAESHRDLPIRLTASDDGCTRASYSIMNHVERFVGPHSLAFSPDLSRLYCGLHSALAVFPLSTPGLNTHSLISLTSGKRSVGGQKGIVSSLAAAAHPTEPAHEPIAVGTFDGTVAVYSFDPMQLPEPTDHTAARTAASQDQEPLAESACLAGWREVEGDGITQLRFHPLSPYVLFVASRRSDYIYVYDTRYLMGDGSRWSFRPLAQPAAGVRSAHLLAKLRRSGGATRQRIYFDVDWAGRWLATGDEQGLIHMWRIDAGRFVDQSDVDADELEMTPDLCWKAHQDTVGSVVFHPHEPLLASVSGSRRWPDIGSASDSGSEYDTDSSDSSRASESARRAWTTNDSSLKVWDFSEPPAPAAS